MIFLFQLNLVLKSDLLPLSINWLQKSKPLKLKACFLQTCYVNDLFSSNLPELHGQYLQPFLDASLGRAKHP